MIKTVIFGVFMFLLLVLMIMQFALFLWILRSLRRQQTNRRSRRNVGLTLLVVGSLFCVVGIGTVARTLYFKARADQTIGRVIALERHEDKDGITFAPVFAFTNLAGERFEATATIHSNPPDHKVDDIIPVLYMPHDPATARPNTFVANWLLSVVFGGVGTVLAGIGACILMFRRA